MANKITKTERILNIVGLIKQKAQEQENVTIRIEQKISKNNDLLQEIEGLEELLETELGVKK